MELGSSWLLVILGGVFVIVLGLLIFTGGMSKIGHLPGDIRYNGKHTKVFVPLTSMLLLSLFLSLLVSLLSWFFR